MRTSSRVPWLLAVLALLASLALLTGCSSSASTAHGHGTTPTATSAHVAPPSSTSPPASAPPHAFAWTQFDGSGTPQIWASINGAVPAQITHVAPAGTDCNNQIAWSPPVFSPDLRHIVAALGGFNCGDGPLAGPLSIITVAGGAIANVPGADTSVRVNQRTSGWLNDSTIYYVTTAGLHTYTIGAGSPTALPGVTKADEAVLRGNTLFWMRLDFAGSNWTETLHRYDMSAHSALPGVIAMGQVHECQCSPGDFATVGWDAAPDGAHVVYQAVTPKTGVDFGIATSRVYYANADGSSASLIAQYMVTSSLVRMQISPNGALVAITHALPSPSVITASVTSPGRAGDPNFHSYTPDALDFPVWKWDSTQFWAATKPDAESSSPGTKALYNYQVGVASGSVGVSGGYNPWYTIGG